MKLQQNYSEMLFNEQHNSLQLSVSMPTSYTTVRSWLISLYNMDFSWLVLVALQFGPLKMLLFKSVDKRSQVLVVNKANFHC